ncbi:Holliday junction branch migration protein RuvA [Bergeyella zoohelcum]|uniref:Holliday junction branch migration complex subunit RuvA n=1 Tax=Bergeyella zoohelcum ATCC 43767 TaxID=883096 RepID=K1LH43_9FLAO|nr:Holliday junction branch migration protein RuvA [Bergeyella zoohelcum]EKB55995.1 Holliday junction DNA helicase RuvA [Bergeyella zoohelcum ATCC 43767]SUV50281.1 Holliday junction ATP-dependent DNA helicase RuvA [Bergeyella zoohelcum]
MIFSLKGIVQELHPTLAIIDVNGVGYGVNMSLQTSQKLVLGQTVHLFIQQLIREDAHPLYGFFSQEEKELFNLLISVNGVGASSALILLSSLTNVEIVQAISNGQSVILQKAKGIGAKTAERIIIDLRDKVLKFNVEIAESTTTLANNRVKQEAVVALEVLGITKKMSEKIADKIIKSSPEISVEELVKQILKSI